MPSTAIDDPHKIVKVIASDGRSGDQKEVAYTNCKVIGNSSFGIVFQAKLETRKVMTSPSRESFTTNASRCTHILDGMASTYCITLYIIVKGYRLVNIIFYILTYKLLCARVELQHGTRDGYIGEDKAFIFKKRDW